MPDIDYRSLPRGIQIFLAVRSGNPAAFTGDSNGILLFEIARKERWMIRHGVRILAELRQTNPQHRAKFCQSLLPQPQGHTERILSAGEKNRALTSVKKRN